MSGLDDDDMGELEGDEDVESGAKDVEDADEDVGDTDEENGDLDEDEEFADVESDADGYDDDSDEDLKVVDEALSHKDQNARALAIRRAIEERLEAKRLSQDLDYLDLDLDDED